ncbi:hypothetical protein [Streptomyces sp. NPDC002490]|uniref:hypothetical protein n=1 Tax=Streptomyces sp. NPDC002490 TaxID=3154416 RepID=UPI003326A1F0
MDIPGTPLRALRAALFTALTVTLSTASHVLLSGVPLPLSTTLGVTLVVFVLAYALAGRQERGFGPIAALLVPLELTADTVFTVGQHTCYGPAGGPVTGPLRSVGLSVFCGGTEVGTPLTAVALGDRSHPAGLLAESGPATSWLLLGAHLGVGLLASLWLWRGERALGRLLRTVAVGAFRPLLLAARACTARGDSAGPSAAAVPSTPVIVRPRLWTHSVGRRGPPCSPVLG